MGAVTTASFSVEQNEKIKKLASDYNEIKQQIGKRIVGLDPVIELILISIFSGSHSLLVGVPGLAKTLLVSTMASLLELKMSRIQFTPDLMPSDITGAEVILMNSETGQREFKFLPGPIFAHMILADEINRTPPKTQSALIEAMEEKQISSLGRTLKLEPPFVVLATLNPIEMEGTYSLPAAQLDRFLFRIPLDYPTRENEYQILIMTTSLQSVQLKPILTRQEILDYIELSRKISIEDRVMDYAVQLIRNTRPDEKQVIPLIREYVQWGVGTRACQGLILGAKTRAMLYGRTTVTTEDIRSLILPVLGHRMILNYQAEVDGITVEYLIQDLLQKVPCFNWAPPKTKKKRSFWKFGSKV
ncbi:MAG: MoxR family ATPase [Planctomycetota bacterium]